MTKSKTLQSTVPGGGFQAPDSYFGLAPPSLVRAGFELATEPVIGSIEGHKAKFYQLHILRAFAAFLVVLDHACLAVGQRQPVSDIWIHLAWLAGFVGVTIFFVISGFIMVRTTQEKTGSLADAYDFFSRRVHRVVPMYYLATATAVVMTQVAGAASPTLSGSAYLLCSLLFVPVMSSRDVMEPIVAQGWTLNYEMYFYFLFACSLCLGRRLRSYVLITGLVASVIGGSFIDGDVHGFLRTLQYWAAPIVLNFAFGMLLAEHCRPDAVKRKFWSPVVACVAVTAFVMFGEFAYGFFSAGSVIQFDWKLSVAVYALALACCWICIRQSSALPALGVARFVARAGVLLGDASYMTYLFHLFVISALCKILAPVGFSFLSLFSICVVASTIAGVVLSLLIERPVNERLARRRLRGLKSASSPAPSRPLDPEAIRASPLLPRNTDPRS